jgi:hypothetical protein
MLFRCPAGCVRFRTRGVTTWLVFLFPFGWHGFHGQVANVLAFFNISHNKSKSLFYQGTIRIKVKESKRHWQKKYHKSQILDTSGLIELYKFKSTRLYKTSTVKDKAKVADQYRRVPQISELHGPHRQ